jgi:hypothetical protein
MSLQLFRSFICLIIVLYFYLYKLYISYVKVIPNILFYAFVNVIIS